MATIEGALAGLLGSFSCLGVPRSLVGRRPPPPRAVSTGSSVLPAAALAVVLGLHPSATAAAPTLELYGTFSSMGVVVTIAATDDPNSTAVATVQYRPAGTGAFRAGHPLVRVGATRLVGSLFWLAPGTAYDVRVSFSDADRQPLDAVSVEKTASTRAEIVVPPATRSRHVSPSGSGTACTLAEPCSLQTAVATLQAGDEVVLRGGVYYEGEHTIDRSGTATAPIVFRSHPGERAILDGSDPGGFTWTSQGGGVYRTTLRTPGPHVVMAGSTRLFPYATPTDLRTLAWGVPGFHTSGHTLDVRLAGDANPASATIAIARYNGAFYLEQRFVYFLDLTFRYYGGGDYAKAIYFLDASDNLVRGCTFVSNDVGVGIKYDSHRNVIEDSVFEDAIAGWPWEGVKSGADVEDGGVYVYDPMTGRGTVVRRNRFSGEFDGLHVSPAYGSGTNETDVHDNLVYDCGDDGIEVDGYASNVRLWGNTFRDTLMGMSLAPVVGGPVYAIRNLISRTGKPGIAGSGFKFNVDDDPSGEMFLFHNTVDAVNAGQDAMYIMAPGTWARITARNNVFSGTQQAIANENTAQPIDFDYDVLHTSGGALARWEGLPEQYLPTLADLRAATGLEMHGISAVPGFADAANGDYTPGPGSPLVDRGVRLPGINDVYSGTAPDVGALESGSTLDADHDGLPDDWETSFGLNPGVATGADGRDGDPDGDGASNAQEYAAGTHPRGTFVRYFAEGATIPPFSCQFALANVGDAPAITLLRFLTATAAVHSRRLVLGPRSRVTLGAGDVTGLGAAEFSTLIESDAPVVVDRTMTWDADGYGSHAETSVPGPSTVWYLAEGATHSGFDLFYTIQNPEAAPAAVTIRYLRPGGQPVLQKTYTVAPASRFNVWVDMEEFPSGSGSRALEATDVSAHVTSDRPVIVERSMYLSTSPATPGAQTFFVAGHESAGVTAPAQDWFLAEGATGDYFDLFVLIANPNATAASVRATYLLPGGGTVTSDYLVDANSRFNVWVDHADPRLADTAVSTSIHVTNGVPVLVERAMWWPGSAATWQEAHNSPGATATATSWALAEGEVAGPRNLDTYVLVANTSAGEGTVRVTLLFEGGGTAERIFTVAGQSRFNVDVRSQFPAAIGRRFAALVESLGTQPAQIVVERAMYGDAGGQHWAAGTNALATRLK